MMMMPSSAITHTTQPRKPPPTSTSTPTLPTYRGIANVNGTSCHTSSALQLLFNCFPRLRDAMLALALVSAEIEIHTNGNTNRNSNDNKQRKPSGDKDDNDGDNAPIRKEFAYQLAWFFHLLAYSEDVLDLYRVEEEDETEEVEVDIIEVEATAEECKAAAVDAVETAPAAAAVQGKEEEGEEGETSAAALAINATKSEEEGSDFDAQGELKAYLAVDALCHESASIAEAQLDDEKKKERRKTSSTSTSRSSSSRRHSHSHRSSSHRSSHRSSSSRHYDNETDDASHDDSHRSSTSSRHTTSHGHHSSTHNRRSNSTRRRTSKSKSKSQRRSSLINPKEVNLAQRAAIDAFMSKTRTGSSSNDDWDRLVRVMKGNNRDQYGAALGMVLDTRNNTNSSGSDSKKGDEDDGKNENEGGNSKDAVGGTKTKSRNDTTFGNLGGGRPSNENDTTHADANSTSNSNNGNSAIDPTSFYSHLTTYTSTLDLASYINTNNVGDAAMVFRCLISALEYSTKNELARLERELSILEIESWNNNNEEGGGGEVDDGNNFAGEESKLNANDMDYTMEKPTSPRHRLKSSLELVQTALLTTFRGTLVSRIVGSTSTTTMNYTAKFENRGHEIVTIPTTITTTTTTQRTKRKGGNLERPIPIPFPLPVVRTGCDANDMGRYFPSLAQALTSITIEPAPIRGYDWRGLMKRGSEEVVEEMFVKKMDSEGNEIVDENSRGKAQEAGDRYLKGLEEAKKKKNGNGDGNGDVKAATENNKVDEDKGGDIFLKNGIAQQQQQHNNDDDDVNYVRGVNNGANEMIASPPPVVRNDSEEDAEVVNNKIEEGTEIGIGDGDVHEEDSMDEPDRNDFGNQDNVDQEVVIIEATSAYRVVACQTDFGYEKGTQTAFDEDGNVIHAPDSKTIEVRSRVKEAEAEEEVGTKEEESEAKEVEEETEEKKDDDDDEMKVEDGSKNEEGDSSKEGEEGSVSSPRKSAKFAMEKDACYAAAVSALTSRTSRISLTKGRPSARGAHRSIGSTTSVDSSSSSLDNSPRRHDNRRRGRGVSGEPIRGRMTREMSVESIRGRRMRDTSADSSGRSTGGRFRDTSVDSGRSTGRLQRGSSVEPSHSRRRVRDTSVDSRRSTGRMRGTDNSRSGGGDNYNPFTPDSANDDGGGAANMVSYGVSPNTWDSLPGFTTPAGMEIGSSPGTPTQGPITVSYSPESTPGSLLKLPGDSSSDDSDSSKDESSVDSQVSSVDTDTPSSDDDDDDEEEEEENKVGNNEHVVGRLQTDDTSFSTKSSDIETPPNIDDLSLGSFTDDSLLDEDEKKEEEPITVTRLNDVDSHIEDEAAAAGTAKDEEVVANPFAVPELERKGNPFSQIHITEVAPSPSSMSAVSDSDDDESSSSSSSSSSDDDSSSDSSSSSSSTSSTDSSSEESSDDDSTSSSSSSEKWDNDGAHVKAIPSNGGGKTEEEPYSNKYSQNHNHNQRKSEEWVTRKETRLCHPLPHSLVFHLKRFEYSRTSGRVEKLPGVVDVPEELDMKTYCLESGVDKDKLQLPGNMCCYRYCLSGAIVHVDPIEENEDELEYGQTSEGHYVTFICSDEGKTGDLPQDKKDKDVWTEIDDECVRAIESVNETLSGCDVSNKLEKKSVGPSADAANSQSDGPENNGSEDELDEEFLKFIGSEKKGASTDKEKPSTTDNKTKSRRRVVKEKERRYATLVVYSRACECT